MKNKILIAILLLAACTKEQTTAVSASSVDNVSVKPKVVFNQDEICFDGTFYYVSFTVKRLQAGDVVYAGATNGTDVLSKVQVMSKNGDHGVQVDTRESGPGVTLYVEIDRAGKKFLYQTEGNKVNCN